MSGSEQRRTWSVLALLAGAVFLTHGANLLYLARAHGCLSTLLLCPGDDGPWSATPDTRSYLQVADDIAERGVLRASYIHRTPGYPWLLARSRALTGSTNPTRWLGPLCAALATLAIGWLALHWSGRRAAALWAGLIWFAWPSAYSLSAVLLTDAPHAALAVSALAASLWWRSSERRGAAWLAGALWIAAQTLRHTFFALPALLPLLFWKRPATRRYIAGCVAIGVATCAVPIFVVSSNSLQHDIAVPSALPARLIACVVVSRLRADVGEGEFAALRRSCNERFAPLAPGDRVRAQLSEGWGYLGAHPGAAFASYFREFGVQMAEPLRFFATPGLMPLYAPVLVLSVFMPVVLFWVCALLGFIPVVRRTPQVAAFLLLAMLLVILPALNTHRQQARLRHPLELFSIPLAGICLDAAWLRGRARVARKLASREPAE